MEKSIVHHIIKNDKKIKSLHHFDDKFEYQKLIEEGNLEKAKNLSNKILENIQSYYSNKGLNISDKIFDLSPLIVHLFLENIPEIYTLLSEKPYYYQSKEFEFQKQINFLDLDEVLIKNLLKSNELNIIVDFIFGFSYNFQENKKSIYFKPSFKFTEKYYENIFKLTNNNIDEHYNIFHSVFNETPKDLIIPLKIDLLGLDIKKEMLQPKIKYYFHKKDFSEKEFGNLDSVLDNKISYFENQYPEFKLINIGIDIVDNKIDLENLKFYFSQENLVVNNE